MIHFVRLSIGTVGVFGVLSSLAYHSICILSAVRLKKAGEGARSTSTSPTQATPLPVSILKPVKGIDPEMYESLRSHCLQSYSDYEIIFGVSDHNDPAIEYIQRLQREFPGRSIQLIVCQRDLGTNTKVSNLAQMLPHAAHEIIIVNDGDIRVRADYLSQVAAPLADPKVGLVTCLYQGVPASTLGSWLESAGISTDFCPGILAAVQVEGGLHFGLGSTLAFRRSDLAKIGGFESFVDYLADDYELGYRISSLGLKVELSQAVVETYLPPYSVNEFFAHQLRWARTIRTSRPGGFASLAFTFGLFWSLISVAASGGARWSVALLGVTLLFRLTMAAVVGGYVLAQPRLLMILAAVPLRDLVGVAIWAASFFGRTVSWRGELFELKKGKLSRVGA